MKTKTIFLLSLLGVSNIAFAEGGCPVGTYPANSPATNICNPFPGNENNGQPQQPQGRWVTKWGAIAIDETVGTFGAVKNFASKRLATKAAVAACKANGGMRCETRLSYYNQCAVLSWGDAFYSARSEATIELASKVASQKCDGLTKNCKIVYADCSLPVWVE